MTNSQTKEVREKIADVLRTGNYGIAETRVVNGLLQLIKEEKKELLDALYSMYKQYCNDNSTN